MTARGLPLAGVEAPPLLTGGPAPCRAACPVGTDAAAYVALVAEGRTAEAYDVARRHNPFASVCGRVCSAPCERACRRGIVDAPIAIRALKRVVASAHGAETVASRWRRVAGTPPPATRAPVCVIGGGPAGLAAAHDLRLAGHAVTVLEASHVTGGMLVHGIPAFRLPRDLMGAELDAIAALGVTVRTGVRVGTDVTLDALLADFALVIVAAGCHGGRGLDVPGAGLPGVVRAVDFLRARNAQVTRGDGAVAADEPVVVVGGGSVAFDAARSAWRAAGPYDDQTAVDAARSAARGGVTRVTMVAPERRAALRVPAEELHEASVEGVTLRDAHGVVRILGTTHVEGVEIAPVVSLFDEAGRFAPRLDTARTESIAARTVVLAIGQRAEVPWLHAAGLATTPWGGVPVHDDGRTTHPRLLVAGDLARGPGDLIDAIASGQRAAATACRLLGSAPFAPPPVPTSPPMPRPARFWTGYDAIARAPLPVLPTPVRDAVHEVEGTLAAGAAAVEGARCLRCDEQLQFSGVRCIACTLCVDVCPTGALAFGDAGDALSFAFDEDRCIRCQLCVHRCPVDALAFATLPTGIRDPESPA